jgi:SAM-dependent methyltransferase
VSTSSLTGTSVGGSADGTAESDVVAASLAELAERLGIHDRHALRNVLRKYANDQRLAVLLRDLGALESALGHVEDSVHLARAALALDPWLPGIDPALVANLFESAPAEAEVEPAPEPEVEENFVGQYYDWRLKRISAIVARYGAAWFHGARVLEVGCGYGDIGVQLRALGADVTFSDGREEHLEVIAERYPSIPPTKVVAYDAEEPWPFGTGFDLVINMGLVYHVDNWAESITGAMSSADRLVLETEVCDSDDPDLIVKTVEQGADQALSGTGSRPSAAAVEAVLRAAGWRFDRLDDSRCNSGYHRYDWPVTGSGEWEHGLRRFWFAWRDGAVAPH